MDFQPLVPLWLRRCRSVIKSFCCRPYVALWYIHYRVCGCCEGADRGEDLWCKFLRFSTWALVTLFEHTTHDSTTMALLLICDNVEILEAFVGTRAGEREFNDILTRFKLQSKQNAAMTMLRYRYWCCNIWGRTLWPWIFTSGADASGEIWVESGPALT